MDCAWNADTFRSVYSVVIPTLSTDPLLGEALDSISRQVLPPEMVLVVIDADDPAPSEWAAHVEHRAPGVKVITQAGAGMASALNYGISLVQTDYIAFLDSDDLWRPLKQSLQVSLLDAHPDVDAVGCTAARVTVGPSPSQAADVTARSSTFTSTTFRTDVFARFGLVDEQASHYAWLYRWWADARRSGIRMRHIDYVGLERRIHGANSWVTGNAGAKADVFAELRRSLARRRVEESADEDVSDARRR